MFNYSAMKNSYYNVFADFDDNTCVYNTMYSSFILLTLKNAELLREKKYHQMSKNDLSLLKELMFIVDADLDELSFYSEQRRLHKHHEPRTDIMLTVTNACNAACEYCFAGNDEEPAFINSDTTYQVRSFILDELMNKKPSIFNLNIFGGEPMLIQDYLKNEILFYKEHCLQNNIQMKTRFYTNGTLLTNDFLEFLTLHKDVINDFQITLDGPKPIHDRQRPLKNGSSSFDITINNLIDLKRNLVPFVIRINIAPSNVDSLDILLDELNSGELKGSQIDIYGVQSMSHSCANYENVYSPEEFANLYPSLLEVAYKKGFALSILPTPSYLYCSAHCNSAYIIKYNREVYKCALLQNNAEYKVGNLINGKLALSGNMFDKWDCIDPIKVPRCKGCILLPVCGGGCSGVKYFLYNSFDAPYCFDMSIESLKKRMILYSKSYMRGEHI